MWRMVGTHLGWGGVLGGLKTQAEEASVGESDGSWVPASLM